jgi:hypothetical protein
MFLGTLVGCDTQAGRDKLLRSEIVGRREIQTDKYVGQTSFAEDGSLSMSVNWRGFLLRLAPGIAGDYTGTWSISDGIITMRLDGTQKKSGDEFLKMLDALPPGHDEDKKMFGGTGVSREISISGATMTWWRGGKEERVFMRIGK